MFSECFLLLLLLFRGSGTKPDRLYTSLQDSSLLFGPPEGEGSEVGVGKSILEILRSLKSKSSKSHASLPQILPKIDRPYQDWEVDLAWGFDKHFLEEYPEWQLALHLAVFYQMTLASVPSLSVALDGGATAPIDHILSVDEVANIDFSFSVFNPPTKVAVQVDHVCSLIQRHPNKLFLQPSLTHPKVLCPSLPYVRFGVALENEILSTSILPDFDFSLTQQQAECLLSILNCPGTIRTIRTIRHESKQVVQKKQVQWKYRSPEAHSQHESQSLSRSETSFLKSF